MTAAVMVLEFEAIRKWVLALWRSAFRVSLR